MQVEARKLHGTTEGRCGSHMECPVEDGLAVGEGLLGAFEDLLEVRAPKGVSTVQGKQGGVERKEVSRSHSSREVKD